MGCQTYFESKGTKQKCKVSTLQNGGFSHSETVTKKGGLDGQTGPERGLYMYSNPEISQEVSAVSPQGQDIPVPYPPFRPRVGPKNFYKGDETNNSTNETHWGTLNHISRRHSDLKPVKRGIIKGPKHPCMGFTQPRLGHKLVEICDCTDSDDRVSGNENRLQQNGSLITRSKMQRNHTKVQRGTKIRQNFNSRPFKLNRHSECNFGGSYSRVLIHKGFTNAQNKESTEIGELQVNDNSFFRMQIRNKLVGTTPRKLEREKHNFPKPRHDHRKRRVVYSRLGSCRCGQKCQNGWSLGYHRKTNAHKCLRAKSGRIWTKIFSKIQTKLAHTPKNGQRDCSSTHKQNGRYKIPKSPENQSGNLGVLFSKRNNSHSRIHSRRSELSGGLGVEAHRKFKQLDVEQECVQSDKQNNGSIRDRSFRGSSKCSSEQLRQLASGPIRSPNGRVSDDMGKQRIIRFPPFLHDSTLSRQSDQGESESRHHNPSLADTGLLPNVVRNGDRFTNFTPPNEKPINQSSGGFSSTNRNEHSEISGVENFRIGRETAGLSKEAAELLVGSWRQGTQSSYNSCWRYWVRWCGERNLNLVQAPVESIANFLSHLFQSGYEYRTINLYRSAISAFHDEIDSMKIGKHPLIRQILAGAFNKRTPIPRYTKTWNVDIVLRFLNSMESNENLSVKNLTMKLAVLLALTSAGRSSDIQKLDINFMDVRQDEIMFTLVKLTKTRKTGSLPLEICFKSFTENEKLDVVKCILSYIDKTTELRSDKTGQLLISFRKPHGPVKSCTIANWLKRMLCFAGIDTDIFKPHSTRSASTSKANKFGVSIQQIMKIANWSSKGTFEKFYCKTLIGTETDATDFQSTILRIC